MDLNQVISLASEAANGTNDFAQMRWNQYMDNNKEYKRPDLWTIKMLSPAPAIYYPGDAIVNARLDTCNVARNSWTPKDAQPATIRGYYALGAQPNGFVDMSGKVTLQFADKQDYAIELWIKSTRDLISHPETRFSYPVELLMSQIELAYHNTVQQRVKVHTFFNAVPTGLTPGEDNPVTGDVSFGNNNTYEWTFPWHKEEYMNIY
jgi:hypothetical protein